MIWAEFQKYSMLQDEDSEKKQEYVNELGRSVHSFIRTGVRNSQLDELEEIEEKFHKKYEERFDIGQVIDLIKKSSQEKMKKKRKYRLQEETRRQKIRIDSLAAPDIFSGCYGISYRSAGTQSRKIGQGCSLFKSCKYVIRIV